MPPRPITPALISSFLEQSAYAMNKRYGAAFIKLVKFLIEQFLPMIPKSCIASRTRLELLAQEIVSSSTRGIKEPAGHKIGP